MYESPFYIIILFLFIFDFKEVVTQILVERHFLGSSHALTKNTQNSSRKVVTEGRREISRRGREIFVLSERNLG